MTVSTIPSTIMYRNRGPSFSLLSVLSLCSMALLQITISNAAFVPKHVQQNLILTAKPTNIFGRNNNVHFLKKDDRFNADDDDNEEKIKKNKIDTNAKRNKDDDNSPSWLLPSDKPESAERRARMVQLHEEMQRFVHGPELQNLRNDIKGLQDTLQIALATDDLVRIVSLSKAIETAKEKDPEIAYSKLLKKIEYAKSLSSTRKKYKLLPRYIEEALAVRKFIPRLNMEGLWIGNFGTEGSQLINVTYVGDTLIATKVTGECQVPKGEVAFKAHLFPNDTDDENKKRLDPIPLNHSAANKWNIKKLDRYVAEGQIMSNDTQEKEVVDGQLIMFEGYFSFLYLPTKQHIFFSRPSSQLVIHLMKDVIDIEDELQNMKDHLSRCFEKDISEDFIEPRRVKGEAAAQFDSYSELLNEDKSREALKESNKVRSWVPSYLKKESQKQKTSFWVFHKWMTYIDSVLKPPNKNDGFA